MLFLITFDLLLLNIFCNTHAQRIMTKRVLLVLTSHGKVAGTETTTGWYLSECAHPYFRFKNAGYDVHICSVSGGVAPPTPNSLETDDEENRRFWNNEDTRSLTESTRPLFEYDGKHLDLVFFVGGTGTMWDFYDNPDVNRIAREVYERGGVVAAVCHGPIALVNVRLASGEYLVDGKKCTGFSNEEETFTGLMDVFPDRGGRRLLEDLLMHQGAQYTKAAAWAPHIECDERLFTGQNPASAAPLADAIVKFMS